MKDRPEQPENYRKMLKNVAILSGMWGMGIGAAFVQIPAAQNVLVENGYSSISTVPLGLIFLLSSPCAIWIPKLITRYGEKRIRLLASIIGIVGSLLQMTGVLLSKDSDTLSPIELTLILFGASIQAFTYASSNNLRFAVAQFCITKEFLPKATALVLFGGVISSLLGPLLSNVTRHMLPVADYAGNFLQISIMYFVFGILALLADFKPPQENQSNKNDNDDILGDTLNMILADEGSVSFEDGEEDARSDTDKKELTTDRTLSEILFETELILLTCFQCLSYNIMALYMTQVQLPMISLGYSADARTYTITAHMIAMFLPGLFTGHIIDTIGTWTTTLLGFIVFLVGGGIMLANDSMTMFIVGMTMIGVGWNLTFVGPSSEISRICHTQAEKTKVVGFNDGVMLATIGIFSLTGSLIYQAIDSWRMYNALLMIVSGISALIAAWREVKYRLQPLIEANSRAFSESLSFDQQLLDQL